MRMFTMHTMVYSSDSTCIENIQMDQNTFNKLCHMLHTHAMLRDTRNIYKSKRWLQFSCTYLPTMLKTEYV